MGQLKEVRLSVPTITLRELCTVVVVMANMAKYGKPLCNTEEQAFYIWPTFPHHDDPITKHNRLQPNVSIGTPICITM